MSDQVGQVGLNLTVRGSLTEGSQKSDYISLTLVKYLQIDHFDYFGH